MISADDVTICVCTYGDKYWHDLALERAIPSAENQTSKCEIIHSHSHSSLSEARNNAARLAETEFVIYLDADDELDVKYVEKMIEGDVADVNRPATLGVVNGVEDDEPVMIPRRPLLSGNFIVIGAMCNREKLLQVSGFRNLPILEDWDLWIRMAAHGASLRDVPEAIYRVHVHSNSRNQNPKLHRETWTQILRDYRFMRDSIKW